jgi:ribonuclease VapC
LKAIIDTSAVIAKLFNEPGGNVLIDAVAGGSLISDVNRAEVIRRLIRDGASKEVAIATEKFLGLESVAFDGQIIEATALIFPYWQKANLSLGDCICLATAKHLGLPVLTADRKWKEIEADVGVEVILIR